MTVGIEVGDAIGVGVEGTGVLGSAVAVLEGTGVVWGLSSRTVATGVGPTPVGAASMLPEPTALTWDAGVGVEDELHPITTRVSTMSATAQRIDGLTLFKRYFAVMYMNPCIMIYEIEYATV